jgi:predicted metal-dependent peptidase
MLGATNGKRLFLIKDNFFPMPLANRIFLLAHEICHPMMGHIVSSAYYRQKGFIQVGLKKMPFNDTLANMAQDYVINDMLINSRIGKFIEGGCWDTNIATYKDSWIDAYEKLLVEAEKQKKGKSGKPLLDGKGNPINPGKGKGPEKDEKEHEAQKGDGPPQRGDQSPFDGHMGFGEGEPQQGDGQGQGDGDEYVDLQGSNEPVTDDMLHRELQKAKQSTAAAMELARARGNLPASLQIFCEKILEPTVAWEDHLFSQFARKLGSGGYDFRRPDRRFLTRDIIVPGRTGFAAELVIVGMDTSGSIFGVPSLVDRWWGETSGILEQIRPKEIHVVFCDAKVQKVIVIDDPSELAEVAKLGVKGGGGTRFEPVFEYADKLNRNIDCLAYLTDGYGSFPKEAPRYPVIWGDISGRKDMYPFGDVVTIPVPANL